jgi:hypothetical protein
MTQVGPISRASVERKMGGKPVLRLLLQDSDDLTAALLGLPPDGSAGVPAVQSLVRERHEGVFAVQVLERRLGRSDLLLQELEGTPMPDKLRQEFRAVGRGALIAGDSFASMVGNDLDVLVLSAQAELTLRPWRDADTGYLISPPPSWEWSWDASTIRWFIERFTPAEPLEAAQLGVTLERVVGAVKRRLGAHVIVFNAASFDPHDEVHTYHGIPDTLAVKIQRFNLALTQVSVRTGISIVDVDRLLAELGGAQHVLEALVYSTDAHRATREEFLRILEDIGFFEHRWLAMQVGQRHQ